MPGIGEEGCGAFGAGEGPAGIDPPAGPSARVVATPVKVMDFDPYDRVYPYNADFTPRSEQSAVIHRAAHLLLPAGSVPAVTDGIVLKDLRNAGPDRRQRAAENAAANALKVLTDAGLLVIESVTLEVGRPWSGRFFTTVRDVTTGERQVLASGAR